MLKELHLQRGAYFLVKFINTIAENHLVVNIGEYSIERKCKANYC